MSLPLPICLFPLTRRWWAELRPLPVALCDLSQLALHCPSFLTWRLPVAGGTLIPGDVWDHLIAFKKAKVTSAGLGLISPANAPWQTRRPPTRRPTYPGWVRLLGLELRLLLWCWVASPSGEGADQWCSSSHHVIPSVVGTDHPLCQTGSGCC